jgi:poly(A)-specific ribonuclease
MYVARPYNFNLSPLFLQGDKLEIYRDITLSSSAVHFLMKNSFDMGAVFTKGVPYLSREEEASALQNYIRRQESQSTIPDIIIPPSDVEAHKFYDKAKKTISDWFGKEQVCLAVSPAVSLPF